MFKSLKSADIITNYRSMVETAKAFSDDETDLIALLANLSALIKVYVDNINWAGFYLLKGKDLVLGPFQGRPACVRIGEGKGVCGRAVLERKPVNVPDISQFPGHIACDSDSASELVIPLFKKGEVFGVLDLDSPLIGRFTSLELDSLGELSGLISNYLDQN